MSKDEFMQEETRIKLYLEASLMRKVDTISVKQLTNIDLKNKQKVEDITYNVWLYNIEVLKEIVLGIRNTETNVKFKLGSIIWEDLATANDKLRQYLQNSNTNLGNNSNSYYAILSIAYVGNAYTKVIDDDPRDSEIKLSNTDTKDVYYINGKQDESNKSIQTYHWFYVRDKNKIVYQYLVNFSLDANEIKCYNVNCNSNSHDIKYCHNDQKYFCSVCVEDFHNKQMHNTLKKHVITNAITYSINYTNNCNIHKTKTLDFFCYNCNGLFCTKCFDPHEVHGNIKNHDVRFINDIFSSFENEMISLTNRIKEMLIYIDEEMEKRNNSTKEISKLYKNAVQEINERLAKAQEELDNEILFRSTYLASVSVEIQRIITEIDTKIVFLKNQYSNADMSTYIAMSNMFSKYMKEELLPNLDLLCNINFEQITTNLFSVEKKDNENLKS